MLQLLNYDTKQKRAYKLIEIVNLVKFLIY